MQDMSETRAIHGFNAASKETTNVETTREDVSRGVDTDEKPTKDTVRQQQPSITRELLSLFIKIVAIITAFFLLFTFVFGITRYQEASMYPAIKDGDLVVFYRHASGHYLFQDVVALRLEGETQFMRVVATAGDTVDITEGRLLINGAPQQEIGIFQETERFQVGVDFPLTVPEGQVFVLGDNRAESIDSRIYGCVEIEDIMGKVMMVIRKRGI